MRDLFGNEYEEPDEYTTYLASRKWADIRHAKLMQAGYVCERCGLSNYSVDLEVHHLTYARLGRERMTDLQVLCPDCHVGADTERVVQRREDKKSGALIKGFQNFLDRGHSNLSFSELLQAKRKFLTMLKGKSGNSYSLDLSLLGYNDPDPEWKP